MGQKIAANMKPLTEEEVRKLDWVQQLIKEFPRREKMIVECAKGHSTETALRYALEF